MGERARWDTVGASTPDQDLAAAAKDRELRAARPAQPGEGPFRGTRAAAPPGRAGGRADRRGTTAAATSGPTLLSGLDVLDPRAFRLFLGLLGDALAARAAGDTEVKTVTSDGTMEVLLRLVPDGGAATVKTEDGELTGPEHSIEITDLAP